MGIPVITAISVIFYVLMALTVLPVVRALQVLQRRPRGGGRPRTFLLPVLALGMLAGMFVGGWVVAHLALARFARLLPDIRSVLPGDGAELVLLGISAASMAGTLILVLLAVEILSWFYAARESDEVPES